MRTVKILTIIMAIFMIVGIAPAQTKPIALDNNQKCVVGEDTVTITAISKTDGLAVNQWEAKAGKTTLKMTAKSSDGSPIYAIPLLAQIIFDIKTNEKNGTIQILDENKKVVIEADLATKKVTCTKETEIAPTPKTKQPSREREFENMLDDF